jgi:hypothetical protein
VASVSEWRRGGSVVPLKKGSDFVKQTHQKGNCKFEGFASLRSRAQQKIFHCNVNFAHPTIFFLKGSEKFLRDASPDKQVAGLLLKIPKWKRKKFYCNKYFNWKIFIIHL